MKGLEHGRNACDLDMHGIRVPDHEYSQTCFCDSCSNRHQRPDILLPFPERKVPEDKLKLNELRFNLITETEARSFILPRNYLRRWFVGGKLFVGAISPTGYLVAAIALSAPGARSKRFTPKNTLEVRRMTMEDCCEKNCESAFIAWVCRFIRSRCPQIKYVITFGDPRYDKETPYLAAGFTKEKAYIGTDWSSHKTHRARESPTDKIRLIYRTWNKDITEPTTYTPKQAHLFQSNGATRKYSL